MASISSKPVSTTRAIKQRGSDRPALKYLNRHVVIPIAPKWHDVGLELMEVEDEKELDQIKAEGSDNKENTKRVLKLWLDKNPHASWNDLILVLRIPTIGLRTTALEIEGMLLSETNSQEEITTYLDYTSDVTTKYLEDHEKFMLKKGGNDHEQISKDDTVLEETLTELPKQSLMLVPSNEILPTQPLSTCTVDSEMKRNPFCSDNSPPFPADNAGIASATGLQFFSKDARSYLQSNNNITNVKMENSEKLAKDTIDTEVVDSKKSIRICEAVSKYYKKQFIYQWVVETNTSPINSLAALLVERDGKMKVVVFTTGTATKRECSYSLNDGNADERMWGHCDGHAVSVCYRFVIFYLITEMHRCKRDTEKSILKYGAGGYKLKKCIKLHFFTTKIPCGFMANEDCYFLSWKIPFKRKPHCLQCSSTILIGAYLGIQGPLSHLFKKPVYISSITIPKCEGVIASKSPEIKKRFESFGALLLKSTKKTNSSDYEFQIPDFEIADTESRELFSKCYKPCNDENSSAFPIIETQVESKITQTALPDTDTNGNSGPHVMNYTLDSKMGTDDFREIISLQLKNTTKKFPNEIKCLKLKSLKEAQQRLSVALNVDEALKRLKTSLIGKMDKRFTTCYQNSSKMIQCRSITNEVTVHINKLRKSVCSIIKRSENVCNVQRVKEVLPALRQKFETDSQCVIESLDSLNTNMNELENDTKSIVDMLTNYHDYQETLDSLSNLLEKGSCNCQDFMSCDWARYLGTMDNDIQKGDFDSTNQIYSLPSLAIENQQQQLSSENKVDIVEGNTENESQNTITAQEESQNGIVKPKERVFPHSKSLQVIKDDHDSIHQVSSLLSSPSLPNLKDIDQQQQPSIDDDDDIPKVASKENGNTNSMVDNNEETNILQELQESLTKRVLLHSSIPTIGSHDSLHQMSSLASSQQDEDKQQQVSKLVCSSNTEKNIQQQPQYQTTVQKELQETVDPTKEKVLPYSDIPTVVLKVMKSPLMIIMFVVLIIIILCYICDINWLNTILLNM